MRYLTKLLVPNPLFRLYAKDVSEYSACVRAYTTASVAFPQNSQSRPALLTAKALEELATEAENSK